MLGGDKAVFKREETVEKREEKDAETEQKEGIGREERE